MRGNGGDVWFGGWWMVQIVGLGNFEIREIGNFGI